VIASISQYTENELAKVKDDTNQLDSEYNANIEEINNLKQQEKDEASQLEKVANIVQKNEA